MKTKRLRDNIKSYLAGGPKSTAEILEYINTTSRHGTTTQQLGNVLSKDADIVKVGMVGRAGGQYGSYKISEWALRTDPDSKELPASPKVDIKYVDGRPELVSID